MSTTDIPLWDYFVGNNAFLLDFVISTYIGVSLSNLSNMDSESNSFIRQMVLMGAGIVVMAAVIFFVVRIAKREFDQMIKSESYRKEGRTTGPKLA
mmetsp:Transcript_8999/g.10164  ORF Transcript_8999/g.10164 Transcript_8999/m.10164 type:complete len:96 (+) Transcript_8999:588-875(+)